MSSTKPRYEFTSDQNEEFLALVANLRRFRTALVSFALLQLGAAIMLYIFRNPAWGSSYYSFTALLGFVTLVFAVLSSRMASEFKLIVDTEGADIEHLMTAFRKMKRSFAILLAPTVALLAVLVAFLVQTFSLAQ